MLALCLMLLASYYAQNYAAVIGWSLTLIMTARALHAHNWELRVCMRMYVCNTVYK